MVIRSDRAPRQPRMNSVIAKTIFAQWPLRASEQDVVMESGSIRAQTTSVFALIVAMITKSVCDTEVGKRVGRGLCG